MNKLKGYILLYRSLKDHWLWYAETFSMLQAFIDILLSANHIERTIYFNGQTITVHRGEFVTSIKKLSKEWKWSPGKVKRFLEALKKDGMISYHSDTHKTTIKVLNYDVYQNLGNKDGQQKEHKQTAGEKPTETNNTLNELKKEDKTASVYKSGKRGYKYF